MRQLYIHDEWAVIERACIPPQVPWYQRRDLKMFFYQGAEAMYRVMRREGIAPATTEENESLAERHIRAELDELASELMAARAEGQG